MSHKTSPSNEFYRDLPRPKDTGRAADFSPKVGHLLASVAAKTAAIIADIVAATNRARAHLASIAIAANPIYRRR